MTKYKQENYLMLGAISLVAWIIFALLTPFIAVRAADYVPLAPIPGTTPDAACGDTLKPGGTDAQNTAYKTACGTNLGAYLTGLFKVAVAIAGVLAFLMIVWGGFTYLSTDAITGKEEGKEKIERAVGGLVLALAAYIILNTINPQLVSLNLNFGPAATPAAGLAAPGNSTMTLQQFTDLQDAREARTGTTADTQEQVARDQIFEAENSGAYTPEQALALKTQALGWLSEAAVSRATNSIGTAGNLGNAALTGASPNLATAQAKLTEIGQQLTGGITAIAAIPDATGLEKIPCVASGVPGGTPLTTMTAVGCLEFNAVGRYAVLATGIATVDINKGNSNIARQMMANIDAQNNNAQARVLDDAEAAIINTRAQSSITAIKTLCANHLPAPGLTCRNYPRP